MLKTISRFIFGGAEETAEDVKSVEAGEEGWHVVTHQEAEVENREALLSDTQPSSPGVCGNTSTDTEADRTSDAEPTGQSGSAASRAASGVYSQPKTLAEVTRLACIPKAKAWADRHCVSRNAIQRQNRVRQGVQSHSFQLQQPGHRSLSH